MIMERKEFYEAPSTTVVEVKFEGMVCASGAETNGATFNGFNNEQGW